MLEKIKNIISPDEKAYNENFRNKYIPKKYNQIELVDYLENEEIDHYISISNRSDGKSFNYIHYFLDYAIRTGVGFTLVARHYTVRFSYQKLLQEIIDDLQQKYDPRRFHFIRTDFYILVGYEDKEIGIITDLNQATDLKYLSNFMKHFPIIIYDEFLALESDYLIDEWERLKTIYSSINRKEEIPYIKYPKIFYLGNAVNFASPILANLDIFNHLENQPINTVGKYDNVLVEMRRNDNVNEQRNLRAFKEENDNMTLGEFETNKHNIADDNFINLIRQDKIKIVIKTQANYLVIEYNRKTLDILLSITTYEKEYHFNTELVDNTENSIFLDEGYYDEEHYLKYDKDLFKFNNQYSKDVILGMMFSLSHIKITKVIQVYEMEFLNEKEIKEIQYKDNYLEQSKRGLMKKFFGV